MNETTKKTPFDLLIGVTPPSHYPMPKQPALDDNRLDQLQEVRVKAKEAVLKAQDITRHKKISKYVPYEEGDRVWLEGKNLKTTHPTAKLAPKWYGPFTIKKKISDIVFQLELPNQWKIHNVFHASLLSPYLKTNIHGPNYPEPPPDIIEGEPEFEVEQIVGSRRIGKKKTLQYKVRWKGYAPAHDSWELANQVHVPELVKRYKTEMKTRSSQKKSATINSTSASGIRSRLTLHNHHYQSPLTNPETLKDSKSGKRTRESCIIPKEEINRPLSSDRDKRRTTSTKTTTSTSPSPVHINQCTMDPLTNPSGYPLSYDEAARQSDKHNKKMEANIEAAMIRDEEEAWRISIQAGKKPEVTEEEDLEETTHQTRMFHIEQAAAVAHQEDEERIKKATEWLHQGQYYPPPPKTLSPTGTEPLHPGYPYQEHTDEDTDITTGAFECPYLAMVVDRYSGDPHIHSKKEINSPTYDEGPLQALPIDAWDNDPIEDDFEHEVEAYPFGESAYLDTQSLQAIGTLGDRGLAADGLRLVQLDGEFQHLIQWEKRLAERERELVKKRGYLLEKQCKAVDTQKGVFNRLKAAKAASWIAPLLYDHPGRPAMSFKYKGQPYNIPNKTDNLIWGCYWCGDRNWLCMHKEKDCANLHTCCHRRRPGHCIVPEHHTGYYGFMVGDDICLYKGNHCGKIISGDHA
jgi:hypothetical protein